MKRGFMGSSKKEPADSRTIRKSTREESIDTLQAASIDSVNQASNDIIQLVTVHHGTVYPGTVHLDTIHPASIDTVHLQSIDTVHLSSIDTVYPGSIDTVHLSSIVTVHPVSIDTVHPDTVHLNLVHRDTVHPGSVHPNTFHPDTVHLVKNDTTCGETEKIEVLILEGAVIPDVIVVAEMNDFDLSREWYDWVGQDPFQGLSHQDPINHIEELEDLLSEQNEVSEYHMLCKIFPYSISGDAFRWDEQHEFGEPSRVAEAETKLEPVEERVHESEASHNADSKHLRPLICAEEADGFHKRVKRIHDPVKIVISCDVVEVEFPIPPDRFDKGPAEAASIDTSQIPSNDINKPTSIDATTSPSIETGRVSEQKEFDVCGNLRDGETTTRSDKSGGKKRRN
uniref:Uncharacterized protein n=1 Tax=Brassica oleracea TaxID=3712 RepID=A0A3P6CWH3_BRAOL|nr:unnamed protein product [Brassica oleracea]